MTLAEDNAVTIAVVQTRLNERGAGLKVDSWGGDKTRKALDKHLPPLGGNVVTMPAAKPTWPADNDAAIRAFYGAPGDSQLVKLVLPYPMRVAWDLKSTVSNIYCHKLVRDSLERILRAIFAHYGSLAAVKAARMDLYGGCYNYRKMTGGSSWSRHAWGIAIDLDPDGNGWKVNRPPATMPEAVVKIFETEGWKSGGRAWGHDWMHFQATG